MSSKSRTVYLLNYVFLTGLAVLAVNDHFWKEAYGNWWTGKISDFAGILILPLLLKFFFGWRDTLILLLTVVFFFWWKSPWSGGFLALANAQDWVYFTRVVDYSDLLAYLFLPCSWRVLRQPERFAVAVPIKVSLPVTQYALLPICLFFLVATSVDDFPDVGDSNVNCCAQEPVDVMVGNGRVYIPSAFTPDGDGLNDFFQIVADSNIVRIDSFVVYALPDSIAVFSRSNLTDFRVDQGFSGVVFGEIRSASYAFLIEVTARDGTARVLRNRVCALPCPPPVTLSEPRFLSSCTFGNQLDSAGYFDRTVASGETLSCY